MQARAIHDDKFSRLRSITRNFPWLQSLVGQQKSSKKIRETSWIFWYHITRRNATANCLHLVLMQNILMGHVVASESFTETWYFSQIGNVNHDNFHSFNWVALRYKIISKGAKVHVIYIFVITKTYLRKIITYMK